MHPGDGRACERILEALPDGFGNTTDVELVSLDDALARANTTVLLTDHREFQQLDRSRLDDKLIVDTRGV